MPDFRQDPVSGRWVLISADRQNRPNEFHFERPTTLPPDQCPFCPGHEEQTPPEIAAYGRSDGRPNAPGWEIRVVPNRYPALQFEGTPDHRSEHLFERIEAVGAHEVVIETAEHGKTLASMSELEIVRVLAVFRDRVVALRADRRCRYVMVFKNHGGAAGATIDHAHSQVMALPMIPDGVRETIDGARRYRQAQGRCVFCDVLEQELTIGTRVVEAGGKVVALSPYAARVPFETWLLPRRHGARFEEAPAIDHAAFAHVLKSVVMRLDRVLDSPAYNFILHTAPFDESDVEAFYHWRAEIVPRVTRLGGFEWGSGCYINPMSPEKAAQALRASRGEDDDV